MSVFVFVLTTIILFERTSCNDIVRCDGGFCFTIPAQTVSYDKANSWCRNNGTILAVVNDDNARMALTQFLDSTQINSTIYLQYKVFKSDYTWNLLDGTPYIGTVYEQEPRGSDYRLYGYLRSGLYLYASNPNIHRSFVCEFNVSECQNRSTSVSFSSNGRCYVKYDTEALSWFKARERCVNEGGDLAMFQKAESLYQNQLYYWIGIRFDKWAWTYSYPFDGVSREMIYSYWSSNQPNNYPNECVCVNPRGNPKWSWLDCDCDTSRPFVCFSAIPNTTLPSTTTTTPSSSKTPLYSATTTVPVGQNNTVPSQYDSGAHNHKALAIGLGVGIGGAVLLAIVIVAVVLLVKRRSARTDEYSSTRPPKLSEPNENVRVVDVSAPGGIYADILRDEKNVGKNKNNASNEPVIYQVPTFPEQNDSAPAGRLNKYDNNHRTQDETDVYANADF